MYRFLILFLFCTISVQGQEYTYKFVDSLTYSQFVNHQYSELEQTSKEAFYRKIDFYYLRMRLGIALYSEENFEKSLPHFVKAFKMNPADTLVQEYLYYNYIFTNRIEEATILIKSLSPIVQNKTGYRRKIIEKCSLSAGVSFAENLFNNEKIDIRKTRSINGEALINGNYYYSSLLLQHTLFNRLKLEYGLSVFNTETIGKVQFLDTSRTVSYHNYNYQFNLSAAYQFKHGWSITTGLATYNQNFSSLSGKFDKNAKEFYFNSINNQQQSYMASLSISKRLPFFQPILSGTISTFQDTIQYQGECTLLFYPYGNLNFYTATTLSGIRNIDQTALLFTQTIGGKIYTKMRYEANISIGDHRNYITKNGFLTYNTADPTVFAAGFDLKFLFNHLEIIPGYHFSLMEGSYIYLGQNEPPIITKHNYSTHLLTTTLNWNF